MARPIEATPTLEGEDAERLLADLARVDAAREAERLKDPVAWERKQQAHREANRAWMKAIQSPKPGPAERPDMEKLLKGRALK